MPIKAQIITKDDTLNEHYNIMYDLEKFTTWYN